MNLTAIALTAVLSGQALDVATTCYGFRHGYTEGNRLTGTSRSCAVVTVETAAVSAASVLAINHWVRTPWKRQLIYGVVAGIEFTAAAHNMKVVRK